VAFQRFCCDARKAGGSLLSPEADLGLGAGGSDAIPDRIRGDGKRMSAPYQVTPDGVRLALRLTPRASRDRLDGLVADAEGRVALQVRVAAPRVEGAANAALIAYLAKTLKLRRSEIRIVSGETARLKIVALSGDGPALVTRLADWTRGAPLRR
jgi:uncharacterized protein (TIGR00251 family)